MLMAELQLQVAGRTYRLACRDDDEEALRAAAQSVDARASQLAAQLGAVTESRLLLMTALSFAGSVADKPTSGTEPFASRCDPDWLIALADRLEQLAASLEQAAGAH